MAKKRSISPKYKSKRSVADAIGKRNRALKLLKDRKGSHSILRPKRNYHKRPKRRRSHNNVKRSTASPNPPNVGVTAYDTDESSVAIEAFESLDQLDFLPVFYLGMKSQKDYQFDLPIYHCVLGIEDKDADINIFGSTSARGIYDIIGLTACQSICIILKNNETLENALKILGDYSGGIDQSEDMLIVEMHHWGSPEAQTIVREFIYGYTCNS